MADMRYRLVGLGRATKGLAHALEHGGSAVIGRASDCALVVRLAVDGSSPPVSRYHVVIEWEAGRGWIVYDGGSTNGTALLKNGLPPTIPLKLFTRYVLDAGDVIELAGSPDYQFIFQVMPAEPATAGEAGALLVKVGRAAVQQLLDGHAVTAQAVMTGGPVIVQTPTGHAWLEPLNASSQSTTRSQKVSPQSGNGPPGAVVYFDRQAGRCEVTAVMQGAEINRKPLAVGQRVELRDKDLVTVAFDPHAAFLFLDPRAVPPRPLSDILLGLDRVAIGTAADNTCRLADPSLSAHHAVVCRDGETLKVRDLDSANGTSINERAIHGEAILAPGNQLRFGRVPFLVDAACWMNQRRADVSVDIRFSQVSVEIAGKFRLHGVSFGVRQAEMLGVLGPSASGKSTLLRALAGQLRMAGGNIYVNGRPVSGAGQSGAWYRELLGFGPDTHDVGFVQQIDLLQPELTVREILQFAARQMGLSVSEARQRADRAGALCNLGPLLDRVAISTNGQMNLSGGQLKRVCVAIEVLRGPRVLVLDEPTTGQDPKNTNDLMVLFRSLAQTGVTLLMSTHDLRTLDLFDKMVVLCLGRLVYFGPPADFATFFGARSAEDVYASLPDREDKEEEAVRLAERFRASPLYQSYCAGAD